MIELIQHSFNRVVNFFSSRSSTNCFYQDQSRLLNFPLSLGSQTRLS